MLTKARFSGNWTLSPPESILATNTIYFYYQNSSSKLNGQGQDRTTRPRPLMSPNPRMDISIENDASEWMFTCNSRQSSSYVNDYLGFIIIAFNADITCAIHSLNERVAGIKEIDMIMKLRTLPIPRKFRQISRSLSRTPIPYWIPIWRFEILVCSP